MYFCSFVPCVINLYSFIVRKSDIDRVIINFLFTQTDVKFALVYASLLPNRCQISAKSM
jgi:hypothetical protein